MKPKDDWEQLLSIILAAGAGGLFVGSMKGVIQKKYDGWGQWFSLLAGTTLVAVLVGLGIYDMDISYEWKAGMIGVCSFLAEDILMGLGEIGGYVRRDPVGVLSRIWGGVRGQRGDDK